jgi:putative transposase
MGNLLRIVVHSAGLQDRDGADYVFEDIPDDYPALAKVWADQGYTGDLGADLLRRYSINLDIVEKPSDQKGFVLLPRRWVVERTLAWLSRYRRLSKDYEHRFEYSESWVYIASISRMLRKIYPNGSEEPPYKRKYQAAKGPEMPVVCV